MTATILSGLVVLLAQGGLRLEGDVGAGAGYDTNLTLAPSGGPAPGSSVATAWAGLGVGATPSGSSYVHAGLRYDGALHPDAEDLDSHAGAVELLWVQELGDHVALVLAPSAAWSWYRDPVRSGPGVTGRATVRVSPLRWLALRAGYAYSQRWANDDAYSWRGHRFLGSIEARLARGVYLSAGYAHAIVEQTFYVPATAVVPSGLASRSARASRATTGPGAGTGSGTGGDAGSGAGAGTGPGAGSGPGSGSGSGSGGTGGAGSGGSGSGPMPGYTSSAHEGTGVFANVLPYLATAHENTLSASFNATVWEGLYLLATFSQTWGSSAEEQYTTRSVLGGVGYRF